MTTSVDYSYIGVGPVYLRDRNGSGGLIPVGNVSELAYSASEEVKSQRNFQVAGGGNISDVRRVTDVTGKIKFANLSAENIARAWRGTVAGVSEGTVTGEVIDVTKGALVPLARAGATTVVVTEDTDTDPATYVLSTDYEVRPEGIWFPSTSTIPGAKVRVAYANPGQDIVQILTQSAGEYEILFGGLNEALSGKPHVVRMYRARFGIPSEQSLIGDDYAGLELDFSLLFDSTKGAGLSGFLEATLVR